MIKTPTIFNTPEKNMLLFLEREMQYRGWNFLKGKKKKIESNLHQQY